VPRSEVYFADTYDTIGPMGAKALGECGINPVAPAVANAIANATGAPASPACRCRPSGSSIG
jgi:putative selenate reductase molybdopterin-binding subunit